MIKHLLEQGKIKQAVPLVLANKPVCCNCRRRLKPEDITRDLQDHFDNYSAQFYSESAATLCNACNDLMLQHNAYIESFEDQTL